MSAKLFPAGLTIDLPGLDMEMMRFYAHKWNLEHMQMEKGSALGSLLVVHTPRMQFDRSLYSHALLIKGGFPANSILIGYAKTNSVITFQNKQTKPHEVKLLRSGDEIDFLANGASETITICIEESYFSQAFYDYFGQTIEKSIRDKCLLIDPQMLSEFTGGIDRWIAYLKEEHTHTAPDYDVMESQILRHIFSCMVFMPEGKEYAKFQVKRARDLLHKSLYEPLNIASFAKELNISERLLHQAFKSNYGITPKKYLQNLRMHKIKQELLLSDPAVDTICDIAHQYGYFNQSSFCDAYKKMFGELPSHALHGKSIYYLPDQ